MNTFVGLAVLAGFTIAGAASAQEFKGAEVAVEVLGYENDDDLTSTSYRAGVEFGIYGGFGAAADLSFQNFGDDEGVRSFTLHGLYDALDLATVGAFVARDSIDGADATSFGIEAGRSFGSAGVEGFIGIGDDEGADYRFAGVEGTFDITPAVALNGSLAALDADGGGLSRIALGGEYRFGNTGPAVYAEIGRISVEDDAGSFGDSSNYVGLGARLAIGPNSGTTFDSRGLSELITGF